MYKIVKKYLPKFIINIIYKSLHYFRIFLLKGNNFICPICNFQASKFLPYGKDHEAIKKYDIRTTSEIIMGLPGETYQSHIDGIKELIDAEMDYIVIHSCMLLPGSEMATPADRKKWNFKTKFRIIPRDFVKLSSGKNICEIEEIIVGSDVMSFEENLEHLLFHLATFSSLDNSCNQYTYCMKEVPLD